ncbi:MAG: S4 domain-containing protein, partial [Solirubrobacteraceae bacterium]
MELIVPAEAAGDRLDAFLAGPLGSRSRAQRLIAGGSVRVDGEAVAKGHRVRGGERIEVAEDQGAPASAPVREPAPFGVAWEDEHLVVVDKP